MLFVAPGCKKKQPAIEGVPVTNCITHLKGNSFEVYRFDTQSFDANTGLAVGAKGSFDVDSTDDEYAIFEFNEEATRVTKRRPSFTYPTRDFRIEGTRFYYGDDEATLEMCLADGFSFSEQDEQGGPEKFLRVQAWYRKR
jgi:hypothetical protein